jgi:hypothetical protein
VEIFVDFRPSGGCGRVGEGDEVEEIGWWCWNFFYIFLFFFKNTQSRNNLGNYISSAVGTAVGVQSVSKFYNFLFKLGWR